MFESFQRHGNSVDKAVEQSLEAAELLIVRSVSREKARKEAEAQRIERERLAAEETSRALAAIEEENRGERRYPQFPSS
jgi:hypothetical protein